jgi:hypothetical protein
MHVSTRTNSVCKEQEPAGDLENSSDFGGGGVANKCAQLRWACEHKDELGLQGAGTCRRFREECQ